MLTQLASPVLVIGGAHAGKSEWSMQAMAPDQPAVVIATADVNQLGQPARIERLRSMRPASWDTVEDYRDLDGLLSDAFGKVDQVMIDSLNQWLAYLVLEVGVDDAGPAYEERVAEVLQKTQPFLDRVASLNGKRLVMVATEVGSAPPSHRGNERLYRQVVGVTLQRLASLSATVVAMQAGLPALIKEPT